MTSKTDLWNRLGRTDPKHTKQFQRAGGFRGTAIKPMYSYLKMTEEFGPCGTGWGINQPSFQVVTAGEEILVFCTVAVWHGDRTNVVHGVGGDKCVAKFKSGLQSDDEAFKKAFTDAVTNALKLIGMAADVHMGMFDDSKYVNELRQNPHVTRPEDIHEPIQRDDNGQPVDNIPHVEQGGTKLTVAQQRPIFAELQSEVHGAITQAELRKWSQHPKTLERIALLKPDWQEHMRGVYADHLKALKAQEQGDDMRMAG